MKTNLTFEQFQAACVARTNESYGQVSDWSPTDWGCALAGEVGEACNNLKKMRRLEGNVSEEAIVAVGLLRFGVAKELADVVTYACLLASRLGLDLGEAVVQKFNEVSDRKGSEVKLPPVGLQQWPVLVSQGIKSRDCEEK